MNFWCLTFLDILDYIPTSQGFKMGKRFVKHRKNNLSSSFSKNYVYKHCDGNSCVSVNCDLGIWVYTSLIIFTCTFNNYLVKTMCMSIVMVIVVFL